MEIDENSEDTSDIKTAAEAEAVSILSGAYLDFFQRAGQPVDQVVNYMLNNLSTLQLPDTKTLKGGMVVQIPGRKLSEATLGPRQADLMIIGKMPSEDEVSYRKVCVGHVGDLIEQACTRYGIQANDVYFTHLCKYPCPYAKIKMPAEWMKAGTGLLMEEIRQVNPKYILCLGADVVKVLAGKSVLLRDLTGAVLNIEGRLVGATNAPADVLRNPERMKDFFSGFRLFACAALGTSDEDKRDYTYIRTLDQLELAIQDMMQYDRFAMDCEWEGDCPEEGRLMTIQLSPAPRKSYVVCLYLPQDKFIMEGKSKAIMMLNRLLNRPGVRVGGHNFRADLRWLKDVGLDLWPSFAATGFDTMQAAHLLCETDRLNLTDCHLRETDMPKYDGQVDEYVRKKIMHWQMPTDVLLPYAACDADATMRLWDVYEAQLWEDHVARCNEMGISDYLGAVCSPRFAETFGRPWVNSLWNLYRYVAIPMNLAIQEMEVEGMRVDKPRMLDMIYQFARMRDKLKDKVRLVFGNPDFNPNSTVQVKKKLFGDPALEDEDGNLVGSLGLRPIKSTDGKYWTELEDKGKVKYVKGKGWESNQHSPSTDSESLAMLAEQGSFEAKVLKDYRFIDQICKTFLREEEEDKETGLVDFQAGLMGLTKVDGKLHTNILPTTETGRWKSSRPNLQNLPKSREVEIKEIFAEYKLDIPKMRTAIIPEEGCVFIEADLKSAELYTLGYISNDVNLKADLKKGDLHTIAAIKIFKLATTLDEFEEIRNSDTYHPLRDKYNNLRVAAKSVNFGIPYGRGGAAIARLALSKGVDCTEEDGKDWLAAWHAEYEGASDYLQFCQDSVVSPGYIRMPFGRMRHFTSSVYQDVLAAMQREACNAPIQGTVADTINYALTLIYARRNELKLKSKMVLAIHDAVMFCVPYAEINQVKELLTWAMAKAFSVPGIALRYAIDIEICTRWGKKATKEEIAEMVASVA